MSLAADETTAAQVRATAAQKLEELKGWLGSQAKTATDEARRAQISFAITQIERFQKDSRQFNLPKPAEPPPGQPIGSVNDNFMGLCGYEE
jgi:hypothetical protein